MKPFSDDSAALALDADDPLRGFREQFDMPRRQDGTASVYFCSQSLGLPARDAALHMSAEMANWASRGVHGHFQGDSPWYTYQEPLRGSLARLLGAQAREVVLMNGLTVNLHLLLASFYQPKGRRHRILVDAPLFPSDMYALKSHLAFRGLDPAKSLLEIGPRAGEHTVHREDLDRALRQHGEEIGAVLLNPVNFFTGQFHDVEPLVRLARSLGCTVGLDLAHAIGNVPLRLHEWGVDFAVFCTYKYLCGGPGAVGGAFIHERHGHDLSLPRLAGWWGNDPATRFRMHLQPEFAPYAGADGWQVSNPPVLALVPLRSSLALFDAAGMPAMREKSRKLTGFLESLLRQLPAGRFEIITPEDSERRGAQLSMLVKDNPQALFDALEADGFIGDFRQPNVIRVAPAPLYNTYHEVWRFARILERHCR